MDLTDQRQRELLIDTIKAQRMALMALLAFSDSDDVHRRIALPWRLAYAATQLIAAIMRVAVPEILEILNEKSTRSASLSTCTAEGADDAA